MWARPAGTAISDTTPCSVWLSGREVWSASDISSEWKTTPLSWNTTLWGSRP